MSSFDSPSNTTTSVPSTVNAAYWLYIVGAILGIVGAIVLVAVLPAQLATGSAAVNQQLQGRNTNGVDVGGVFAGAVIGGAVLSVLLTLAYSIVMIVFARKMRQGKNWARITLVVLAALQVFGVAGSYGVGALHFLVVLAALILSVVPASNAWFRERKAVAGPAV